MKTMAQKILLDQGREAYCPFPPSLLVLCLAIDGWGCFSPLCSLLTLPSFAPLPTAPASNHTGPSCLSLGQLSHMQSEAMGEEVFSLSHLPHSSQQQGYTHLGRPLQAAHSNRLQNQALHQQALKGSADCTGGGGEGNSFCSLSHDTHPTSNPTCPSYPLAGQLSQMQSKVLGAIGTVAEGMSTSFPLMQNLTTGKALGLEPLAMSGLEATHCRMLQAKRFTSKQLGQ